MSGADPLKSAISYENRDDTSLALPSVNQYRSGAQRVREQFQSIKKTKSKHSSAKSGSTSLPPTSPSNDSNGSVFLTNGFFRSFSLEKNINNHQIFDNPKRQTAKKSSSYSGYRYESGHGLFGSMAAGKTDTSRSEPALALQPKSPVSPQRMLTKKSTYIKSRSSSSSQYGKRFASQSHQKNVSNGQVKTQYHTGVPISPVQMKPQPSIIVSNGSAQTKSQSHAVVPNGLRPVETYSVLIPKSPGQIRTHHSMFVSSSSGQNKTQYPTADPKSLGQMRGYRSMIVSSTSGQNKTQYSSFTPNGPEQIKTHQSMIASNGSGHNKSQYVKSSQSGMIRTNSTTVTDGSTKIKEISGVNEATASAPITLKEAVEFLSKDDENYQYCGASYIQHNTFVSEKAKEEVFNLKGISPLVSLLDSSSAQVRYTASAALRNLSYKSDKNKKEILHCKGIPATVTQLRDSDSDDLSKQLTGLLWNLSSADYLKSDLMKEALPVLTEHVLQPYTNQTSKTERDPEVFFHTTGCIRNLSSANEASRRLLRKQKNLVDSLVSYIKECVDKDQDDESLYNSLCILHNLSYNLEFEAPEVFSKINALASTKTRSQSYNNVSPVGCFSSSSKPYEYFDYPVMEEQKPRGAGLLIHSTTLQSYLSLLDSNQREEMQETCCKIMQNLTSNSNAVSNVMSEMIVQKLNGMQFISPLLTSDRTNLQTSAMFLVGNLVKNPNLASAISTKAFPKLADVLRNGMEGVNESDDSFAMACQTAGTLLLGERDLNKKYLNLPVIGSLQHISKNKYYPKSSKAASLLLLNMWSNKDLQSYLRKIGMNKSMFVNDITMAAQRSAPGIY